MNGACLLLFNPPIREEWKGSLFDKRDRDGVEKEKGVELNCKEGEDAWWIGALRLSLGKKEADGVVGDFGNRCSKLSDKRDS